MQSSVIQLGDEKGDTNFLIKQTLKFFGLKNLSQN